MLLKALSQAITTAFAQPNEAATASRQLSSGPAESAHINIQDVIYTTISNLLVKLTNIEAGCPGGRDFTQYSANFTAEEYFAINEVGHYTANDFVNQFKMRRGAAEALKIAVAKEIVRNEAAAMSAT